MSGEFVIKPVAHIQNEFNSKFGIPRQSGLLDGVSSTIIFEPQFRNPDALRGIEEYSHIWLIWQFSESLRDGFRPTVRPPRLGGNKRVGVFATRSPFRPNSMGLSCVRLIGVRDTAKYGRVLEVAGADLMNGTPIFDIKPYVKYSDSHPEAECSFSDEYSGYGLKVSVPDGLAGKMPEETMRAVVQMLKNDPRPAYQHDAYREYAFEYGGFSVRFRVVGDTAEVTDVLACDEQ